MEEIKGDSEDAKLRSELANSRSQTGRTSESLRNVLLQNVILKRQVVNLNDALKKISNWHKDAHEHDEDMGHDLREFGEEDWNQVEAYAKAALGATE